MSILFLDDWRYYPTAIADTQTKNQSFVRMASLLKSMGIQNHLFPLALLQPQLQGVDPYDEENLTLEQKVMIIYECDNNPWYYMREIVIDEGAGTTIDECKFRANRGNIAAMWLMMACIDYIRIQPRQTGKSFETYAQSDYLMYFMYKNTALNLITKDESLRKDSISKMKGIRDGWPDYLCRNTKSDDNNQISLSCKALDNKYYTHVGQKSEKAANNLGRGMTSPFLHFDEPPFIDHIETTVSAATGATNTARDIAKRKKVPYCNVFTTTAGDKDSRDGRYIYEMVTSGAVWNECFYDAENRDDLVELIRTNSHSRAPLVNLTMSHAQLGFSDQWLYDAIANARSEGYNIDRDFFNRWVSSSAHSPIPEKKAERIRNSETDPTDNWISKENYIFRWYEKMDPQQIYVVGLDTSNAVGRDDIALVAINSETGATAGAGTYNETNLMNFAGWLCEFMVTYPNTILIPENKHNAQTIIDYLMVWLPRHGQDPFRRIYSEIVQDQTKYKKEYRYFASSNVNRPSSVYDLYRKYFGFKTNSETRDFLFATVLPNAIDVSADQIYDRTLISQMLSLTIRNGRIDHASGMHDDMVIAWLLSHWLIHYGRNLSHYGIQSQRVLTRSQEQKKQTPEEQYKQQQNDLLQQKVDRLHEALKSKNLSEVEVYRLERELETAVSRMDTDDDRAATLDALLESAKEQRDNVAPGRRKSGNKHVSALLA